MTNLDAAHRLIQSCGRQADTAVLIEEFLTTVKSFGFHSGAGGGWTGVGRNRAYRFYFNSWPADWLALYNREQVFFDDPIILEAQRRMEPFLWHDLAAHRGLGERQSEILALGYDYGWVDGLVVPIHGPGGYQGVVSLAAMQPLDLSQADISLLWAASLMVHARCRVTQGLGEGSAAPPVLTSRETECMRWVALGKTDWEIGKLLGISPATAHFHVERAKKRLVTGSRTHAVALLVLHGVI